MASSPPGVGDGDCGERATDHPQSEEDGDDVIDVDLESSAVSTPSTLSSLSSFIKHEEDGGPTAEPDKKKPRYDLLDFVKCEKKEMSTPGVISSSSSPAKHHTQSSASSSSPTATPAVKQLDLSSEQQRILRLVVEDRRSVFITGGAGTGKTFLLRAILRELPVESTFVTATTGIAALQLSGSTLHSFAGCGIVPPGSSRSSVFARLRGSRKAIEKWRKCRTLVIDEISMLGGDFFDILEYVARKARRSDEPFGGIQLVLSGDFLQLPPVGRGYTGNVAPFCFETKGWLRCNPKVCVVSQPFRQRDEAFFHLLREMRLGVVSGSSRAMLQTFSSSGAVFVSRGAVKQEGKKTEISLVDEHGNPLASTFDGYTFLRPRRVDVDKQNCRFYNSLTTPEYYYRGFHEGAGYYPKADLPELLQLRVGCRVMLTKNLDVATGLVNGSTGSVSGFLDVKRQYVSAIEPLKLSDTPRLCVGSSEGGPRTPHTFLPIVAFEISKGEQVEKREMVVGPAEWKREEGREVISRDVQLPLIIAYAITVHKSQGMSLHQVDIDFSHIFEAGQAYVALSRCTNLNSVRLHSFCPSTVMASESALAYYQALEFTIRREDQMASQSASGRGSCGTATGSTQLSSTLPLLPCGYYCSPTQAAEDDSSEGEEEWDDAFANEEDEAPRRKMGVQNEATQLDHLRVRIRDLLTKTQDLKETVARSKVAVSDVRGCRLVMDATSFFDLWSQGNPNEPHSFYQLQCVAKDNMLRVPLAVLETLQAPLERRAAAWGGTSPQSSQAEQRVAEEYSQVVQFIRAAQDRFECDVQRKTEFAALPLQQEAWRKYARLLPAFQSSRCPAHSPSLSLGEEDMETDQAFVRSYYVDADASEEYHRAILEYAMFLCRDQSGVGVLLCTSSTTLAASALSVGIPYTSLEVLRSQSSVV